MGVWFFHVVVGGGFGWRNGGFREVSGDTKPSFPTLLWAQKKVVILVKMKIISEWRDGCFEVVVVEEG